MRAQVRALPDGRLHLQDGPIDLMVEAIGFAGSPVRRAEEPLSGVSRPAGPSCLLRDEMWGSSPRHEEGWSEVAAAYRAATDRFTTILDELCAELPALRRAASSRAAPFGGVIARRMSAAVAPFADEFITPMAAVAGAVAEEVLLAMMAAVPLARASVNNGGDIALHLAPDGRVRIGLVDRPDHPSLFGAAEIGARDGIGGIATSGWRGRSFSLGIADAVTILAPTAAEADAAATVVANAVDLPGHPGIARVPARDVQCDSDLGARLVTRNVAALAPGEIDEALARGRACADGLIARGLIRGAALHMQGCTTVAGWGAGPLSLWKREFRRATPAIMEQAA